MSEVIQSGMDLDLVGFKVERENSASLTDNVFKMPNKYASL